jgi:hypothetical protein
MVGRLGEKTKKNYILYNIFVYDFIIIKKCIIAKITDEWKLAIYRFINFVEINAQSRSYLIYELIANIYKTQFS